MKHHRTLSFNDFWVTDQNYFLNNWGFSKECDWSSRNKHEKWSVFFMVFNFNALMFLIDVKVFTVQLKHVQISSMKDVLKLAILTQNR